MKSRLKCLVLALTTWTAATLPVAAHATWSVVAVDAQTGEVGAAGATCGADVAVIARVVPGKGAVVAQGLTSDQARDHASTMIRGGSPADAVIEAITSPNVDDSFFIVRQLRQYGVAVLRDGKPSVDSFTGYLTANSRGAGTATGVTVQGNMLASEDVLNNSLAAYVNTPKACGLAIALLNALEAGSRHGGDSRCSAEQSALSAFLIVAKPNDPPAALTIRLIAPNQKAGGANPVLQLRDPLRKRLAEKSMLQDGCLP